jgi:hypothetical protein
LEFYKSIRGKVNNYIAINEMEADPGGRVVNATGSTYGVAGSNPAAGMDVVNVYKLS